MLTEHFCKSPFLGSSRSPGPAGSPAHTADLIRLAAWPICALSKGIRCVLYAVDDQVVWANHCRAAHRSDRLAWTLKSDQPNLISSGGEVEPRIASIKALPSLRVVELPAHGQICMIQLHCQSAFPRRAAQWPFARRCPCRRPWATHQQPIIPVTVFTFPAENAQQSRPGVQNRGDREVISPTRHAAVRPADTATAGARGYIPLNQL